MHIDLEDFFLIPGPIYTDRWSDRPNGGRLLGGETKKLRKVGENLIQSPGTSSEM